MQVQPTAMVSMTARWRQGPVRGGSGQRRRRTGTWLNTGTLTMLRSSCMVKGFTQPRHRHRASGRSAGTRLGSWLMLQEGGREQDSGRKLEPTRHAPAFPSQGFPSHSKTVLCHGEGSNHVTVPGEKKNLGGQDRCPRLSRFKVTNQSPSFLLSFNKIPILILHGTRRSQRS